MPGAIFVACVQIGKQSFVGGEEWMLIWEDTKDIYGDNFWVVSLGGWSL